MLFVQPTDTPNTFQALPGEAWGQGFATYGGYVAAAAYRAARMAGHDRPLLSAQINFLAPAATDGFTIEIDPLRVGKGTSVIEARVWSPHPKDPEGDPILASKILFTMGSPREASLSVSQNLEPSQLAEFQRQRDKTADTPALKGVIPAFISQFQFRPFIHGVPFAGGSSQDHAIAFKPRFELEGSPAEALLLLSDINPPPQLTMMRQPAPASTASWMVTFEDPLRETLATDWFYVLIHLDSAGHGYGSHSSMIFDAEGRHVTSNRQATTVFERDVGQQSLKSLPKKLAFRGAYALFQLFFKIRGRLQRGKS